MEKLKFKLPVDSDRRMLAAAILTSAITNMECGKDDAIRRVHALYEEILNASIDPVDISVWNKLSDD